MSDKNPYLSTELKHFMHTFKRQPLLIKKGRNSRVWDQNGKQYFDFFSGLAVCGVGHNDGRVVSAIRKQSGELIHSSNYFYTAPQMELAKELTRRWAHSRVFFSNSGAEANELAIKLARLWATKVNKPGREILTFDNAFHGRTLATAAASSGIKRQVNRAFEPLPTGFRSVAFNNLEEVRKAVSKKTIAIMLEPIQGEGGIHVAHPDFLKGIAALCGKHNLLLILDEVQSGMGRTGTFFAFEQYGVKPDIVSLAKGLAGGMPLGATLAQPRVADLVVPGLHGSTFGGNPVSCAASLEVLKLLTPAALKSIQATSKELWSELRFFRRYSSVKTIRGMGLMIGMELDRNGWPYVSLARKRGLLINCTQDTVVRFLPPYFIGKKDLGRCLAILKTVFDTLG